MLRLLCIASGVLALTAASPAAAQDAEPCDQQASGEHSIRIETVAARPGARLSVTAVRFDGPFGGKDVSLRCLTAWRVTPSRAARLSRDRTTLIIDQNAAPGTVITLEARVGATITRGSVTVVGSADPSVLGRWRRSCGEAPDVAAIATILIERDRYFLYDFEGRQWSGSYDFDPHSRTIAFGPHVLPPPPESRLEGTASVDTEARLTLEGVYFGDPWQRPAGRDCPMVFSRAG